LHCEKRGKEKRHRDPIELPQGDKIMNEMVVWGVKTKKNIDAK
jgi:hypothetical protein